MARRHIGTEAVRPSNFSRVAFNQSTATITSEHVGSSIWRRIWWALPRPLSVSFAARLRRRADTKRRESFAGGSRNDPNGKPSISHWQTRDSEHGGNESYGQTDKPRSAIEAAFVELYKHIGWFIGPVCHFTNKKSFAGSD